MVKFYLIMAGLYKQYMRLLQKWPLDINKQPDFGHFLRDQIRKAFPKGESSKVSDPQKCLKYFESLDRLASNYYCTKYPVTFKKSSTGLSPDQCNVALSPEVQEILKEKQEGFLSRIANKFRKTVNNPT